MNIYFIYKNKTLDFKIIYFNKHLTLKLWRDSQDKDTSNSNFTPFGGGQRLCPGLDLARLEASIFLHHLVTQFR